MGIWGSITDFVARRLSPARTAQPPVRPANETGPAPE
jgi:hypothetical protein